MMHVMAHWILAGSSILFQLTVINTAKTYHMTFLGVGPTANLDLVLGSIAVTQPADLLPEISSTAADCSPIYSHVLTDTYEYVIPSENCSALIPSGIGVAPSGVRIVVDEAVTAVHILQTENFVKTEGYLAIADDQLGTEYYVLTYCSLGGVCQFAVTPIEDDTTINVVFPSNVSANTTCIQGVTLPDVPEGTEIPFTLNELDVLHFESTVDLTGTRIVADKKVAVVVGARDVPSKDVDETSHLIEQIPPVNKWGLAFIVVPNPFSAAGDIVKIITRVKNTRVTITGYSPFTIQDKGGNIEKRIDWGMPTYIEASYPILVMQIMSMDVYNDTNDVIGVPAMVLVPAMQHWTTDIKRFPCHASIETALVVAMLNSSAHNLNTTENTTEVGTITTSDGLSIWTGAITWDGVQNNKVVSIDDQSAAYGFCNGMVAFLLNADWSFETEGCVAGVAWPGDRVDNDCDGFVDEDVCTTDDLAVNFTLSQISDSTSTFGVVNISDAEIIPFSVTLCDTTIVHFKLSTGAEAGTSFTSIQISNKSVDVLVCEPDCINMAFPTATIAPMACLPEQFRLRFVNQFNSTEHHLYTPAGHYNWTSDGSMLYTEMLVTSFDGESQVRAGIVVKDCGKIISEVPDYYGRQFIVPVFNTDDSFKLYLTSLSEPASVTFSNRNGVLDIMPFSTKWRNDGHFSGQYNGMIIESTAEIAVYVVRVENGSSSGVKLIPTDLYGISYRTMYDDTASSLCHVFSLNMLITWEDGAPTEDSYDYYAYLYDGDDSLTIDADQSMGVFCGGVLNTSLAQIPPLDTLGTHFYIPAINLTLLASVMDIKLVAAEDSTVVTIRGEYDNIDVLTDAGDGLIRAVVTGEIYEIISTKPLLVYLVATSTTEGWVSMVGIPPVSQYTSNHVFHCMDDLTFVASYGVDNVGVNVSVLDLPTSPAYKTFQYNKPTFTLTFLNYSGLIIVPSDTSFHPVNQVCMLNRSDVTGDGVDNDCDGLVDEDTCLVDVIPGYVDLDIDGSINEDCISGTAPSADLQIDIPAEMFDCPATTTMMPPTTPTSTVGSGSTPNVGATQSPPTFSPITSTSPTVQIISDNNVAENCSTECICPCGWVLPPQNYTAEELQQIVVDIQQKLRISKKELSATIRTKISAPDDRTSATAVGYISLIFLALTLFAIFCLDVTTIRRHLRILRENVTSLCSCYKRQ